MMPRPASASASRSRSRSLSPSFPTLNLFVRFMSQTLVIHAHPHDTVNSVILRIQEITGIPTSDQRLVHRGSQLHRENTLALSDVHNNSSLHLMGRLLSSKHPFIWELLNGVSYTINSTYRSNNQVLSMIRVFFSILDNSSSEDESWDLVQIFIMTSVPTALVKLYLSSDMGNRALAAKAIGMFFYSSSNDIPVPILCKCIPILFDLCKLLARIAGIEDHLYIGCRYTLAILLNHKKSLYISRFKPTDVVCQLLPFISELANKVLTGLSGWLGDVSRWSADLVHRSQINISYYEDLSHFFSAICHAVWTGGAINLYNSEHKENSMDSLFAIYFRLLGVTYHCLSKLEIILSDMESDSIAGTVADMVGILQYFIPHFLKDCSIFSLIHNGAQSLLRRVMSACSHGLNEILKSARRNPYLFFILIHKDLLSPEARRNLVLMMLPANEAGGPEIIIDRSNLLAESFQYIAQVNATLLHGGLLVEFKNEEAMGHGVLREWFYLLLSDLFSPQRALFLSCSSDLRRFFPNPAFLVDRLQLEYFGFCGRLIALALKHNVQVGITFDDVLFLQLAGRSVTLEDVKSADPYLYKSCKYILGMDVAQIDSDILGLTFSREIEELGSHTTIELCPGGKDITVNSSNREKYVDLLIKNQFVISISEKVTYFAKGFGDILTDPVYQTYFFNYLELEDFNQLLGGIDKSISLMDWKAHTVYNNYMENDPQIQWFWKGKFEVHITVENIIPHVGADHYIRMIPERKSIVGQLEKSIIQSGHCHISAKNSLHIIQELQVVC